MPDPLIILGPPRSFTSVACAMLGQHPQMYGFPEVHLFVAENLSELFYFYQLAGRMRQHGLLRVLAELFMKKQTEETVQIAKKWLIKNKGMTTGEVFKKLLHKVEPRIVVEKSVTTIWRPKYMERVEQAFPNTRYLHLTRHPRAQCESMLEAVKTEFRIKKQMLDTSTDPPTLDPQILWYKLHTNINEFLAAIPAERKMHMRGEDLLVEPDTHLAHIAQWLNLRVDAEAIDEMKHPERSPFSSFGPENAKFGNDPKFLKEPALRPMRAKPQSLEGAVSWRSDVGFSPDVRRLAESFGYQ